MQSRCHVQKTERCIQGFDGEIWKRDHSLLQIRPILYMHSKVRSQAFILPIQDAIRNRERPPLPYFISEYVSTFDRPVTLRDRCLSQDLRDKYLSEYILHERQNFNTAYQSRLQLKW